ncbi:hypothetical protein, partial [Microscilla marina]
MHTSGDLSLEATNAIAKYFEMTIDELVNFDGNVPEEITIGDKSLTEKVKLIALLDEDEKNVVFK